jgi:hypothetical protein
MQPNNYVSVGLRRVSLPKTPSIWLAVSDGSEHDRRMIAIGLLFAAHAAATDRCRWATYLAVFQRHHQ